MNITPWLPLITVIGVGLTLIQTLWAVFMGPETLPGVLKVWRNKIRANPQPMLKFLFFVNVLLVCYIILYLWLLVAIVINRPPLYGNECVIWSLMVIMMVITVVSIIWLFKFSGMLYSVTQKSLLGPFHMLNVIFGVNILLAILACTVMWGGGRYISDHPQQLTTIIFFEQFEEPSPMARVFDENLPLSCSCSNPVVNAILYDVVIPPSNDQATINVKFTNPNIENMTLSFELVTLRDPRDGNTVYKGVYKSFVVPAKRSISVPVIFHLDTNNSKTYIFSMSLFMGSYWKYRYQDVKISF